MRHNTARSLDSNIANMMSCQLDCQPVPNTFSGTDVPHQATCHNIHCSQRYLVLILFMRRCRTFCSTRHRSAWCGSIHCPGVVFHAPIPLPRVDAERVHKCLVDSPDLLQQGLLLLGLWAGIRWGHPPAGKSCPALHGCSGSAAGRSLH